MTNCSASYKSDTLFQYKSKTGHFRTVRRHTLGVY